MKRLLPWLLSGGLLLSYPARAQVDEQGRVICLISPVPELVTGGGISGIIKAIRQRVVYPPQALQANIEGRVIVRFAVDTTGRVREVAVVKSLRPDCDSAVMRAVWQLPCFKPIRPQWLPAYFTVPANFSIEHERPTRKTAAHRKAIHRHQVGK
ncbi:TonB family protein [Hymenobacter sp.]|uniref:TonB family protein n=1 Tax=Hymenobacter sp. TaxID=1898978 RepID=UPI0039C89592